MVEIQALMLVQGEKSQDANSYVKQVESKELPHWFAKVRNAVQVLSLTWCTVALGS